MGKSNYSLINIFRIFDFISRSFQERFSSHFAFSVLLLYMPAKQRIDILLEWTNSAMCEPESNFTNINFQLIELLLSSKQTSSLTCEFSDCFDSEIASDNVDS